jgi:hypothetical protein
MLGTIRKKLVVIGLHLTFPKDVFVMPETLVLDGRQLTLLWVPFQDLHHHEGYRMFYGGSDETHQNHSHLGDTSQLVHSYSLHQGIPENVYTFLKAKLQVTVRANEGHG